MITYESDSKDTLYSEFTKSVEEWIKTRNLFYEIKNLKNSIKFFENQMNEKITWISTVEISEGRFD